MKRFRIFGADHSVQYADTPTEAMKLLRRTMHVSNINYVLKELKETGVGIACYGFSEGQIQDTHIYLDPINRKKTLEKLS